VAKAGLANKAIAFLTAGARDRSLPLNFGLRNEIEFVDLMWFTAQHEAN
jgi:hypothetical protein